MSKNIYVGNLSFQTTADDLREAFSPFGSVTSAQVVSDAPVELAMITTRLPSLSPIASASAKSASKDSWPTNVESAVKARTTNARTSPRA